MILKPRKLLALAPAALAAGLVGCASPKPATRSVSVPAPITNAARLTQTPAPTPDQPAATPMCDSDTGRPLPGNVRNGDLGCPAHPDAAPEPDPAAQEMNTGHATTPMVGSDGRPLPGNVGGGKGQPRRQ